MRPDPTGAPDPAYVSTGHLPAADTIGQRLSQAHQRYRDVRTGAVSEVYPALSRVAPDLFGIAIVSNTGALYACGDADTPHTIMSVAKPFVLALVCAELGVEAVLDSVGADATGLAFNSLAAVERSPGGRTNPMVNAGAIATTSLAPGTSLERRWQFIADGLSRFAGRPLELDEEVYASATQTNHRNRAIAHLLADRGGLGCDPDDALDLYTRQSSLQVTSRELALMAATLADAGINPVTGHHAADLDSCHTALATMTTAGLYETSGRWLCDVGLPAKSGISGAVVTVSPGKGGLAVFAPPLDQAGNSVKGQLATRMLSRTLGLDLFASPPPPNSTPPAHHR